MTDAAAARQPDTLDFANVWAESLAQVLSQISGSPLPCVVLPEAPPALAPAGEGDLWLLCACSGGLRGEMSLCLPPASVVRLAQIFISEPPNPQAELTADHGEAATELLRQVAGFVATALKARWGEVQLRLESGAAAPSWAASATFWLRAGEDTAGAALVKVLCSAALAAALRSEKADVRKPVATATTPATAVVPPSPPPAPAPPAIVLPDNVKDNVTLDLLMDVDLAVILRFGSRRLTLREILELSPGSVVALDRQVQEPVDMLLDGRLLARGEVVVVDGNYGLRITEVAPADQ